MNELNHLGSKIIETNRLILRPFNIDDAEDMFNNWASNDNVTKFLTWPSHSSVEITKDVLKQWTETYSDLKTYHWAIMLKDINQVIGDISVVKMDEECLTVELGWCMSEKYWGQGIMPEAAKAVCDFLFDEVGFNRIAALHDSNNSKSGRVMQKIGMKYEGTKRQASKNNQGICDIVLYAILKEDRN